MLEFSPGEFQHRMNSPEEKYEILDVAWEGIEQPMGIPQLS